MTVKLPHWAQATWWQQQGSPKLGEATVFSPLTIVYDYEIIWKIQILVWVLASVRMSWGLQNLSHRLCWNKEGMHHGICTWPRGSLLSAATDAWPPAPCWKPDEPPVPLLLSLELSPETKRINLLDFLLPNQSFLTRGHCCFTNTYTLGIWDRPARWLTLLGVCSTSLKTPLHFPLGLQSVQTQPAWL